MNPLRPISLTLAALGGQGGGVVTDWLTRVARSEGFLVQATSVPGVAQRTGATIYYLEFFPESALSPDGRRPILALMPAPGDCDIVVASELIEAGRMLLRGLVTSQRTMVITSTHRSYTIGEKSALGDGRANGTRILAAVQDKARRCVAFDMAEVAERHGAVISAVLLGAIAGGSGLPFKVDAYRNAIRGSGIQVEPNLAAFDAGAALAATIPEATGVQRSAASAGAAGWTDLPALPAALLKRVTDEIPAGARAVVQHGVARLVDYQDQRHARDYLDALKDFARFDAERTSPKLTESVARGLALWMSVEDTIRVAELKTRADRRGRILAQARAKPGELVRVSEFVKPRVEEICGTLPAKFGRILMATPWARSLIERGTAGRQICTSTVSGFLMLRAVAALKRWRRGTLRHQDEAARIQSWIAQLWGLAAVDYELAVEFANCQGLVRGYGETFERGIRNFERLAVIAQRLKGRVGAAAELARLRGLAAADESGAQLAAALNAQAA